MPVMPEDKRNILVLYRDKPIALPLYASATRRAYFAEDFLNEESLGYIMNEIFIGESDITHDGNSFLQDFFGFEKLASLLIENPEFRYDFTMPELVEALEELVPHQIGDFIAQAREKSKKIP